MSRYVRNRQVRRIGLTALVVVLGVGVWQGVAGATSAKSGKTAKIQRHNANCGRHVGSRAIGTATFSRDGSNTLYRRRQPDERRPERRTTSSSSGSQSNNGCDIRHRHGPAQHRRSRCRARASTRPTSTTRSTTTSSTSLVGQQPTRRRTRRTATRPTRTTTTRCSSGSSRPRRHERHR